MDKNIKLIPNNQMYYKTNSKTNSQKRRVPLNNLDGLPNKEDSHLRQIAKNELNYSNKQQSIDVKAVICNDTKKLLCLDIIVIITILRYISKYIINPFIYHEYSQDFNILKSTINKYIKKYSNSTNLSLFIVYLVTLILFFSFENYQFQNIAIIMAMNFITSIAVDANQLLSGAILSGIIAYAFIRIRSINLL